MIDMADSTHCCNEMARHIAEGEVALRYIPHFREYALPILDNGGSFQLIKFCPWCGSRLPDSLRDEWLRSIRAIGLEPGDDRIPVEYRDDSWWRARSGQ
jgi:hypothetical protein